MDTKKYEEGFYYITSKAEPEPLLVYGYNCSDLGGEFVFGFNTHDGGGLLPLDELTKDTTITPVDIVLRELDVYPKCDNCDFQFEKESMYKCFRVSSFLKGRKDSHIHVCDKCVLGLWN